MPEASPAGCRAAVDAVAKGASLVVLLLADQPDLDLERITEALGVDPVTPVVGGIFPALIDGTELVTAGALAVALDVPVRRAIVASTFEPPTVIASMLGHALEPSGRPSPLPPTLLVLVDGHAPGSATALIDALGLPYLHQAARVFGGGAGCGQRGAGPCLFTERGVLPRGGGLVVRIEATSSVALEHGWSTLAGPFFATKTHHTTIGELDWRPARDVYSETIGATAAPHVSMRHPLAILGPQGQMLVRDPLSFTEDGGIYTFGDMGARALVAILRAEPEALIGAAGAAARAAVLGASGLAPTTPDRPARTGFVFDCVSRADALAGRFGEELTRIQREVGDPLWGVLSLGEIGSTGERSVELHNKTVVVTVR